MSMDKEFEEAVKREQEIIRLKDEISRLTENQRLQNSATAAVMERAEKAEGELAVCREDADDVRLISYAPDMSTCTLKRGDEQFLFDQHDAYLKGKP